MKEIIFPIRQDGKKTEAYAGSTYLINSMRVSGMPYAGTSDMWSCNFARKALATRFLDIENNNEAKKLAEMLSETKRTMWHILKAKHSQTLEQLLTQPR